MIKMEQKAVKSPPTPEASKYISNSYFNQRHEAVPHQKTVWSTCLIFVRSDNFQALSEHQLHMTQHNIAIFQN